jgi:glycerophosphoryl diester phosphodiesterase
MTLAIAHRGESVGQVENTTEAVRAAIEAGAPMVEIDVRLSADGRVVVLHDPDLTRIWGVDRTLASMTWDEVAAVRDAGGHRIPDLAEVAGLAADAGVQLMVDIPAADAGVPAYRLLETLGLVDSCLFAGETRPLRELSSTARIALSWDEFLPPDDETLAFFRPEYFNPHFQLLTAAIADRMHEAGIGVSVWTVDHPRDMRAVIAQGADAVITNRIVTLLGVLQESP